MELIDVELFLMEDWIALDDDRLAGKLLHFLQPSPIIGFERFYHFGIDAQHYVALLKVLRHLAHLDIDLIAYCLHAFDHARPSAVRARSGEGALQRLLDPFARNSDKSEIVELQNLRWRPIAFESFLQCLHDSLTVLAFVHVDEVDNDDAAEVAQSNLTHDLADRIGIRFDDRIFEALRLSDVFASIDVDCNQSFSLVDDDVSAA